MSRLRALGAHPRLEPLVALALRARAVRQTPGFLLRELMGRRALARYELRGAPGRQALLRHGTGDVVTLGEVFHNRDYAPPAPVAALLGSAPRTLDLGANVGLFALDLLARCPGASIEAYEPDPENAAVLRRVVAHNGLTARWTVHEAAAGTRDGEVRFAPGGVALSRVDPKGTLTVPLVDVCARLEGVDLLKMDIEGGEWEILDDPRFGAPWPRVAVLEYHPDGRADPDADAEAALRARGYAVREIWRRADGHGMLWAWRA